MASFQYHLNGYLKLAPQHPFIERFIGTVHREFGDYTLLWNVHGSGRRLAEFQIHQNDHRIHRLLNGDMPAEIEDIDSPGAKTQKKRVARATTDCALLVSGKPLWRRLFRRRNHSIRHPAVV